MRDVTHDSRTLPLNLVLLLGVLLTRPNSVRYPKWKTRVIFSEIPKHTTRLNTCFGTIWQLLNL